MKKAFTMIELIFVILILGIISAIAVPKLAVSRDDARIVKATADINTLIKDIETYYAVNGEIPTLEQIMQNTNVPVKIKSFRGSRRVHYLINDTSCLQVTPDVTGCPNRPDSDSSYAIIGLAIANNNDESVCVKAIEKVQSLRGNSLHANDGKITHLLETAGRDKEKGICKTLN